jgi:hypothetical protein
LACMIVAGLALDAAVSEKLHGSGPCMRPRRATTILSWPLAERRDTTEQRQL